jgi:hypothetical protein
MKDWICSQCGEWHSEHPSGLRERLAELDAEIAATKQWGAKLTALDEERRGILRALGQSQQ